MVRGPIVSKIVNQLLLSTEWGDLDYLVRRRSQVAALS